MSGVIAGVAATALAAGVSAYSANKQGKAANKQAAVAQQQQDFAQRLYDDSSFLRETGTDLLTSFLRTGSLPDSLAQAPDPKLYGLPEFLQTGQLPPAVEPSALPSVPDLTTARRDVLEQQFQQARGNLLATTPVRGGTLGAAMTALEGQRALGVAGLYDTQKQLQYEQDLGVAQERDALGQRLFGVGLDVSREQAYRAQDQRRGLFSAALGLGTQQAETALGGLAGASTSFQNVASTPLAAGQQQARSGQALGSAAALAQKYFKPRTGGSGTTTPYYAQMSPLGGSATYT